MTLSFALSLITLVAQAQIVVTENYASVTVVLNGKTYSGTLLVTSNGTVVITRPDSSSTTAVTAPRLTATLPVAPTLP